MLLPFDYRSVVYRVPAVTRVSRAKGTQGPPTQSSWADWLTTTKPEISNSIGGQNPYGREYLGTYGGRMNGEFSPSIVRGQLAWRTREPF